MHSIGVLVWSKRSIQLLLCCFPQNETSGDDAATAVSSSTSQIGSVDEDTSSFYQTETVPSVVELVGEMRQQQEKHPGGRSDSGRGSSLPTTKTTALEQEREVKIHGLLCV